MNNQEVHVVAIIGRKRSGKDEIARYLTNRHGYSHFKFAGKLKQAINILFGISCEDLEEAQKDEELPEWGVSPRRIMQFVGTEMFQHKIQELIPWASKNFWTLSLRADIENAIVYNNVARVVVSDMRFRHEFECLKSLTFSRPTKLTVLRVDRHTSCIGETSEHVSETEFLEIPHDVVIANNQTLECLYKRLDSWLHATH